MDRCLRGVDDDREPHVGQLPADVAQMLERERRLLRERLHEPDIYFTVTVVEAEAHFVRDHGGEVHDAAEVTRRRALMRWAFGVDAL